jgi:hypothetical protein
MKPQGWFPATKACGVRFIMNIYIYIYTYTQAHRQTNKNLRNRARCIKEWRKCGITFNRRIVINYEKNIS